MKRVFFDFDGTLADTSRGIMNGYNYAFEKKGLPRATETALRGCIGPPLKEALINLAPAESEQSINELAALYREYYSSEGVYELEFFDGIQEMLEYIACKKVQLNILSSKPTVFIEKILERYGYGKYFSEINGVSLGFNNKTKAERLKDQIDSEDLSPADCIVVGDRAEDMNAARCCGTGFIGVLFGYGRRGELNGSDTVETVDELEDLLFSWIEK